MGKNSVASRFIEKQSISDELRSPELVAAFAELAITEISIPVKQELKKLKNDIQEQLPPSLQMMEETFGAESGNG